jgi:hypothetical protein
MSKDLLPIFGKLGLYLMLICILLIVPTSFFNSGFPPCLIKSITGLECPGCGMTRAISSIFHGDIAGAFHYNKLIVVVFPLLAYIGIKKIIGDLTQLTVEQKTP